MYFILGTRGGGGGGGHRGVKKLTQIALGDIPYLFYTKY